MAINELPKNVIKGLREIVKDITGDCDSCIHENDCSHIKHGRGHCWDNSFEPHYKHKE